MNDHDEIRLWHIVNGTPGAALQRMDEGYRIEFLVRRDGILAACEWVRRTRQLYRSEAIESGTHAAIKEYRPGFEQSIREFDDWLAQNPGRPDVPAN